MGKIIYYLVRSDDGLSVFKQLFRNNAIDTDNSVAILWSSSFDDFFKNNEISFFLFDEYAKKIDFNFVSKEVLQLVNNFPHKKILHGKSLVELLDYNGYSLWWFLKQGFYSHCTAAIKEIYTLKLIIKQKKADSIVILNNDDYFMNIVKEATKGISIKIRTTKIGYWAKSTLIFKNKKEAFLNYFPRAVRVVQGFYRSMHVKPEQNKYNVLLFTKSDVWTNLSANLRGDAYTYTILRDMQRSGKYNVIPLDVAIYRSAAWTAIREKKNPFLPYEYFLFSSFFDASIRNILKYYSPTFRNLWDEIDKKSAISKVLVCNKVALYPILRWQIKSYFFGEFDSLIGAIRNIETGRKILHKYGIDASICVDENGNSRFLVFASKMENVNSIALQHGLMAPIVNVAYSYSASDVNGYKNNLNCQFPDVTAMYGDLFKKSLISIGKYEKFSSLVVTGQPRTDILIENKNKYSRERLSRKLGIDPKKKLVVFASQPLYEMSESKITLLSIIDSVRDLDDVSLVVKLHPGDDEEYYNKIIEDSRYNAIAIKNIDLYELLYCSDLVISIQSTVILEALIMNKPTIKVNLIENYDIFGGLKPKWLIEVFNDKDLKNEIRKVLFDKKYAHKINKNIKKFISDYYYTIDGKSTERFMQELKKLLKQK